MTGFDLPQLGGFDLARMQRDLRSALPSPQVPQVPPGLQGREGVEPTGPAGLTIDRTPSSSFASTLANAVEHVQELQQDVAQKTRGLALGEDVEVHDVMIAADKSEVAFNLMLEIRNKLVDAWERLSRSVT